MKEKKIHIKVCGITERDDLEQLVALGVDYAGFIFYDRSPRYMAAKLSGAQARTFTGKIRKTGVFVNATIEEIRQKAAEYELDAVQLHGDESPELCSELRQSIPVIRALGIGEQTDINKAVAPYVDACDYFLFDTAGKKYGGNGVSFNWTALSAYDHDIPFFLSGGIGPGHVKDIQDFAHPGLYAIDINSRFETEPGKKDTGLIKKFLWDLNII